MNVANDRSCRFNRHCFRSSMSSMIVNVVNDRHRSSMSSMIEVVVLIVVVVVDRGNPTDKIPGITNGSVAPDADFVK